jgi:hypothetical protein
MNRRRFLQLLAKLASAAAMIQLPWPRPRSPGPDLPPELSYLSTDTEWFLMPQQSGPTVWAARYSPTLRYVSPKWDSLVDPRFADIWGDRIAELEAKLDL